MMFSFCVYMLLRLETHTSSKNIKKNKFIHLQPRGVAGWFVCGMMGRFGYDQNKAERKIKWKKI